MCQSEDLKYHNRLYKQARDEIHRIGSALEIPYGIQVDLVTEFENYYPLICREFKKNSYPRHISKIAPVLIYQISKVRLKEKISIREIYDVMECNTKEFDKVLSRTNQIFHQKKFSKLIKYQSSSIVKLL